MSENPNRFSKFLPWNLPSTISRRINWEIVRYVERGGPYWLYEWYQWFLDYPDARRLFISRLGYIPDLRRPSTFAEKLMFVKLYRRNPALLILTDKLAVRKWVAERIGKSHLIPLIGVFNRASELDFGALPNQFVIKMSFASQRNILVHDKGIEDLSAIRTKLERWLKEPHDLRFMEWYHHAVPRRILVEAMLCSKDGQVPDDYKFYVFDGKVKFILVIKDRFACKSSAIYSRDWQRVEASAYGNGRDAGVIPRPIVLEQMIEVAERLAEGMPFIRVDLYTAADSVFFGEMTPFPHGGMVRFDPPAFDEELAACLPLS